MPFFVGMRNMPTKNGQHLIDFHIPSCYYLAVFIRIERRRIYMANRNDQSTAYQHARGFALAECASGS
jgi:hypothetical protein